MPGQRRGETPQKKSSGGGTASDATAPSSQDGSPKQSRRNRTIGAYTGLGAGLMLIKVLQKNPDAIATLINHDTVVYVKDILFPTGASGASYMQRLGLTVGAGGLSMLAKLVAAGSDLASTGGLIAGSVTAVGAVTGFMGSITADEVDQNKAVASAVGIAGGALLPYMYENLPSHVILPALLSSLPAVMAEAFFEPRLPWITKIQTQAPIPSIQNRQLGIKNFKYWQEPLVPVSSINGAAEVFMPVFDQTPLSMPCVAVNGKPYVLEIVNPPGDFTTWEEYALSTTEPNAALLYPLNLANQNAAYKSALIAAAIEETGIQGLTLTDIQTSQWEPIPANEYVPYSALKAPPFYGAHSLVYFKIRSQSWATMIPYIIQAVTFCFIEYLDDWFGNEQVPFSKSILMGNSPAQGEPVIYVDNYGLQIFKKFIEVNYSNGVAKLGTYHQDFQRIAGALSACKSSDDLLRFWKDYQNADGHFKNEGIQSAILESVPDKPGAVKLTNLAWWGYMQCRKKYSENRVCEVTNVPIPDNMPCLEMESNVYRRLDHELMLLGKTPKQTLDWLQDDDAETLINEYLLENAEKYVSGPPTIINADAIGILSDKMVKIKDSENRGNNFDTKDKYEEARITYDKKWHKIIWISNQANRVLRDFMNWLSTIPETLNHSIDWVKAFMSTPGQTLPLRVGQFGVHLSNNKFIYSGVSFLVISNVIAWADSERFLAVAQYLGLDQEIGENAGDVLHNFLSFAQENARGAAGTVVEVIENYRPTRQGALNLGSNIADAISSFADYVSTAANTSFQIVFHLLPYRIQERVAPSDLNAQIEENKEILKNATEEFNARMNGNETTPGLNVYRNVDIDRYFKVNTGIPERFNLNSSGFLEEDSYGSFPYEVVWDNERPFTPESLRVPGETGNLYNAWDLGLYQSRSDGKFYWWTTSWIEIPSPTDTKKKVKVMGQLKPLAEKLTNLTTFPELMEHSVKRLHQEWLSPNNTLTEDQLATLYDNVYGALLENFEDLESVKRNFDNAGELALNLTHYNNALSNYSPEALARAEAASRPILSWDDIPGLRALRALRENIVRFLALQASTAFPNSSPQPIAGPGAFTPADAIFTSRDGYSEMPPTVEPVTPVQYPPDDDPFAQLDTDFAPLDKDFNTTLNDIVRRLFQNQPGDSGSSFLESVRLPDLRRVVNPRPLASWKKDDYPDRREFLLSFVNETDPNSVFEQKGFGDVAWMNTVMQSVNATNDRDRLSEKGIKLNECLISAKKAVFDTLPNQALAEAREVYKGKFRRLFQGRHEITEDATTLDEYMSEIPQTVVYGQRELSFHELRVEYYGIMGDFTKNLTSLSLIDIGRKFYSTFDNGGISVIQTFAAQLNDTPAFSETCTNVLESFQNVRNAEVDVGRLMPLLSDRTVYSNGIPSWGTINTPDSDGQSMLDKILDVRIGWDPTCISEDWPSTDGNPEPSQDAGSLKELRLELNNRLRDLRSEVSRTGRYIVTEKYQDNFKTSVGNFPEVSDNYSLPLLGARFYKTFDSDGNSSIRTFYENLSKDSELSQAAKDNCTQVITFFDAVRKTESDAIQRFNQRTKVYSQDELNWASITHHEVQQNRQGGEYVMPSLLDSVINPDNEVVFLNSALNTARKSLLEMLRNLASNTNDIADQIWTTENTAKLARECQDAFDDLEELKRDQKRNQFKTAMDAIKQQEYCEELRNELEEIRQLFVCYAPDIDVTEQENLMTPIIEAVEEITKLSTIFNSNELTFDDFQERVKSQFELMDAAVEKCFEYDGPVIDINDFRKANPGVDMEYGTTLIRLATLWAALIHIEGLTDDL